MSRRIMVLLGMGFGLCNFVWGQDHSLGSNQVVVNTQSHWSHWTFVPGTLDIAPSGEVRPAFVPKDHNAVTDILEHLLRSAGKPESVTILDAIKAGSNEEDIPNLFDGDETTYWEPDPDSPLQDWWFEVDMGRLINATRIGLKFVPEGEGDPFLQFVVLTADNADKGAQIAGIVPTKQVFRTPSENRSQRLFAIDLDGGELVHMVPGRDFEGDMVRFVQVVVTESNGMRGQEVSEGEYETLSGANRGDVVYYKKVGEGEVEIEPEIYEVIDPQVRGTVRYYRRERPRLAELEVYEVGRNIAQGLIADRKGSAGEFPRRVGGQPARRRRNLLDLQPRGICLWGCQIRGAILGVRLGSVVLAGYRTDVVQSLRRRWAAFRGQLQHIRNSDFGRHAGGGRPV